MTLSPDRFAELSSMIRSDDADAHKDERRRTSRVGMQTHVMVTLLRDGKPMRPIQFVAKDFSPRGISLIVPSPLIQGQQFITELTGEGGKRLRLLCAVVHSRKLPGGQSYSVGSEFVCVLDDNHTTAPPTATEDAAESKRVADSMFD